MSTVHSNVDHGYLLLTLDVPHYGSGAKLYIYEDGYFEVDVETTVGEEDTAITVFLRDGYLTSLV